mgnify:CR=1 FL=1
MVDYTISCEVRLLTYFRLREMISPPDDLQIKTGGSGVLNAEQAKSPAQARPHRLIKQATDKVK